MRRNYISPEFKYNTVYGTFNMKEESSFFGSKMLEIEDSITIDSDNLIYYQNLKNEQIDLSTENTLTPYIYNVSNDKQKNHTIVIDESQTEFDKNNNTKWILDINLNEISTNYLFAKLKEYRTFEGVKNGMTVYNDVNFAMEEYISKNVLNRYKYSKLELYIKYNDLRSQNILKYKNSWNVDTLKTGSILKKIQTETAYDYSSIKVKFTQEQPSSKYNFDYYFNIFFEKI
jgi:hypothetical protein